METNTLREEDIFLAHLRLLETTRRATWLYDRSKTIISLTTKTLADKNRHSIAWAAAKLAVEAGLPCNEITYIEENETLCMLINKVDETKLTEFLEDLKGTRLRICARRLIATDQSPSR